MQEKISEIKKYKYFWVRDKFGPASTFDLPKNIQLLSKISRTTIVLNSIPHYRPKNLKSDCAYAIDLDYFKHIVINKSSSIIQKYIVLVNHIINRTLSLIVLSNQKCQFPEREIKNFQEWGINISVERVKISNLVVCLNMVKKPNPSRHLKKKLKTYKLTKSFRLKHRYIAIDNLKLFNLKIKKTYSRENLKIFGFKIVSGLVKCHNRHKNNFLKILKSADMAYKISGCINKLLKI